MPSPRCLLPLLALVVWPSFCVALDPVQIYARNKGSVGSVIGDKGFGSGVVVDKDTVVTNCHVIEGSSPDIRFRNQGKDFAAKLIRGSRSLDLCVLNVKGLPAKKAVIRKTADLKQGERVFAIGNPRGLELTISEGLISGLRSIEGAVQIQTNASISPGSSGGGLFDANGRLIGVTTSFLKDSQNLNFAQPAELWSGLPKISVLEKFDDEVVVVTPEFLDKVVELQERLDYETMGTIALAWLKQSPTSAYARTLAGWSLLHKNNVKLGQDVLASTIKTSPDFTVAYYALAMSMTGSSRQDLLKQCANVTTVSNSLTAAFRGLCKAALGDPSAIHEIDPWRQADEHRSWMLAVEALMHQSLRNYSMALGLSEQALAANRKSAWACLIGANAALGTKRFDRAAEFASIGLEISKDNPSLLELAIVANVSAGKSQPASNYFSRLQLTHPERSRQLKEKLEKHGVNL